MDFVRFFCFTEQILSIVELRFERFAHFRPDLITAAANSGPDCSLQIPGPCAKPTVHLTNTLFDDPLHRASPSGMENAHSSCFDINQDYRHAVSGEDAEKNSRRIRDQTVATQRRVGSR